MHDTMCSFNRNKHEERLGVYVGCGVTSSAHHEDIDPRIGLRDIYRKPCFSAPVSCRFSQFWKLMNSLLSRPGAPLGPMNGRCRTKSPSEHVQEKEPNTYTVVSE